MTRFDGVPKVRVRAPRIGCVPCGRRVLVACVAAPLLLALAAARPAEAQGRFRRVTVNLFSGTVDSLVPFDDPFLMLGEAPDSVTRVELRYWRADAVCGPPPDTARTAVWIRPRLATGKQFALTVGPLAPRRSYCFHFTLDTRAAARALATVRAVAAAGLDRATRAAGGAGAGERLAGLCESILARVRADAGIEVRVRPGASLDCGRTDSLERLVRLGELQGYAARRAAPSAAAAAAARRAAESLKDARDSVVQYGRSATRVPSLSAAAAPYAGFVSAVLPSDTEGLRRLADGSVPGPPDSAAPVALDSVWDPSELEPRLANLQRLARRLDSLEGVAAITTPSLQAVSRTVNVAALREAQGGFARAAAAVREEETRLRELSGLLAARRAAIGAAGDRVATAAGEELDLRASTDASFVTRAAWQIFPSLGLAWFPGLREVSPTVGANFYFSPVNRDAPLRIDDHILKRLSIALGVTTGSVARTGERENLFAGRGLVVGVGFRVIGLLQVGAGWLALKGADPDPLVDHAVTRFTPYVSIFIDAALASLLGSLESAIFK